MKISTKKNELFIYMIALSIPYAARLW